MTDDPRLLLGSPPNPQEAEITPEDRAIAPRFWAKYGTPLFRRLLAAVREDKPNA